MAKKHKMTSALWLYVWYMWNASYEWTHCPSKKWNIVDNWYDYGHFRQKWTDRFSPGRNTSADSTNACIQHLSNTSIPISYKNHPKAISPGLLHCLTTTAATETRCVSPLRFTHRRREALSVHSCLFSFLLPQNNPISTLCNYWTDWGSSGLI